MKTSSSEPKVSSMPPGPAALPVPAIRERDRKEGHREEEIHKKIEHLREWGHLVSIGIMILAMFAFGIHVEGDPPHVKVYWKEVPAILIVFVLAEFGVVLVSAAMEVRVSVQSAGSATQDAAREARDAADSFNELNQVGDRAKDALESLKESLENLTAASEANVWDATGDLISYSGLSHEVCWESLASYTRSWVPKHFSKDCGIPVGLLFRSFVGASGGVRSGDNEVSCATTDSAFAEASQKWLVDVLSKNTEGLVVYAVTTLLPTDFALPHLWWRRNGKPYRVQTLDNFVGEVLRLCRREDVEYKRITVFNGGRSYFPDARVLDGNPDDHDRVVSAADLARSLDEWFIVDDRLATPKFGQFSNLCRRSLEDAGLRGNLGFSELSWEGILDDLKIENNPDNNKVTRRNRLSHTLPESGPSDYARFSFQDDTRQLVYFSQKALQTKVRFPDELSPTLKGRKDSLAQVRDTGGNILQVLHAFDYLSLRDWYVRKMHRSGEIDGGRYWVAQSKKGLESLSIEWDREEIPALDLLLIGTRDKSWLGAAIANLQMDTPSCLVKIVTGMDELERIASTTEALFLESQPWAKFPALEPGDRVPEGGGAEGAG